MGGEGHRGPTEHLDQLVGQMAAAPALADLAPFWTDRVAGILDELLIPQSGPWGWALLHRDPTKRDIHARVLIGGGGRLAVGREQHLEGGHSWPDALGGYLVEWCGPVRREADITPGGPPCLRGLSALVERDLVIEGWHRAILPSATTVHAYAVVRWNPRRGERRTVEIDLPCPDQHVVAAVRSLELLGQLPTRLGRTGRPHGRTDWPRERFVKELEAFCRSFAQQYQREPTQEQAAQALDDMPLQSFRDRFDRYVRAGLGLGWERFTRTYSAHTRVD